jgi:PEP-CTERM motif
MGATAAAPAQSTQPGTPTRRPPPKRAQEALRLLQQAAAHEGLAADAEHPHDAYVERSHAKHARAEAEPLLEPVSPTGRLVRGAGEVATIDPGEDRKTELLPYQVYDTLEHPNAVSVEASQHRLQAALGAGVLEAAVDATLSVRTENSIEKMFWHQMAAVHYHGMRLLKQACDQDPLPGRALPPVEQVRLMNAAARMFDTYQNGLLTWHPSITPFFYDPSRGNLLMEVFTAGGSRTAPFDAVLDVDGVSRAFDIPAAQVPAIDTLGLVTQFEATPVPEPATLTLLAVGLAGIAGRRAFRAHSATRRGDYCSCVSRPDAIGSTELPNSSG